jgi:hypothetical protein
MNPTQSCRKPLSLKKQNTTAIHIASVGANT